MRMNTAAAATRGAAQKACSMERPDAVLSSSHEKLLPRSINNGLDRSGDRQAKNKVHYKNYQNDT